MAVGIRLGIDFGTAHTVGVLAVPGREPRPLLFNGTPLLPSAVQADHSGRLLVGRDAQHAAVGAPGAFEPNPKRCIDDGVVLLGDIELPVTDLIAAVLRRIATEAARVAGEAPAETVLTYPAAWGPERRRTLLTAAAALPDVRLVSEPVAAATYYVQVAGSAVTRDRPVLVYDFGAGTFDTSVVRHGAAGFEVLASEGLPDCGGLDIDAAIVTYLGTIFAPQDESQWHRLVEPASTVDRRAARQLWEGVREAKEMLSESTNVLIYIPLFDAEAPLGREQLERLAEPVIARTAEACRAALRTADVEPVDLEAVFLTGGSSRMPVVSTAVHRALGIVATRVDQPELAVAEGSVRIDLPPMADAAQLDERTTWPSGSITADLVSSPAPRTLPRRAILLGTVAALLAAGGGTVLASWPHGGAQPALSGTMQAKSAVPASPSRSPSPSPRPGIDPCLIGTWRQTSLQRQIRISGVPHDFFGGAGAVATYDDGGRFVGDFNGQAPVVAVIDGVRWEEVVQATATAGYQAGNGKILYSATSAQGTWTINRNGRRNNSGTFSLSVEPDQYVCAGDTLTTTSSFYSASWTRVQPPVAPASSG